MSLHKSLIDIGKMELLSSEKSMRLTGFSGKGDNFQRWFTIFMAWTRVYNFNLALKEVGKQIIPSSDDDAIYESSNYRKYLEL